MKAEKLVDEAFRLYFRLRHLFNSSSVCIRFRLSPIVDRAYARYQRRLDKSFSGYVWSGE